MLPYLELGALRLPMWAFFANLAWVVALLVALAEAPRRDIPRALLVSMWPWAVLGGFVGAHLYYLLAASTAPLGASSVLTNVFRGSAVQGALIAAPLAALVFLRREGAPVLRVLDVCAPGGALAQGISRLGCMAAGCCYGRPAPDWLGVALRRPLSDAPVGVPLHPAQLYEAGLCALLAGGLHLRLRARREADGALFWLYILGYGLIRFFVEFYRGDDAANLHWGLAHSQFTALGAVALGAAALAASGRAGAERDL